MKTGKKDKKIDKKTVQKNKKQIKEKSKEFLDDIFGKESEINWDAQEEVDESVVKDDAPDVPIDKQVSNLDDDFFNIKKSTIRKTTEEGWPVYDVDELNMGKGGDTDKCPFECDCCF